MSDTPRTDAFAEEVGKLGTVTHSIRWQDFSRQLERQVPNGDGLIKALGSANYVVGWLEEASASGWVPALLLKRAEEVEAYLRSFAADGSDK